MILYTNGCSWTWGGSLDEHFLDKTPEKPIRGVLNNERRLSLMWPHHLGKILNADKTVNLADGCGSNQRIMRTTYRWLLEQSPEDLKQTVPVIQFTEWARLEIYDGDKTGYQDELGKWIKCKIDVINNESGYDGISDYDGIRKKIQERILDTGDIEDYYRTVSYLYALKGMFNSFGINEFYIWHLSHLWWTWPEHYRNRLYKDFNVLDAFNNSEEASQQNWKYERVSKEDYHPGILGHKQLAEIIYDRMKEKGYR